MSESDKVVDAVESEKSPETAGEKRGWLLRKRGWLRVLLTLGFFASLLGAVVLCVLFRWPRANWFVYYFVVRPPLVWFGALLPALALGWFGVRKRWFVVGALIWLTCFCLTDEVRQWVRFGRGGARDRFRAAQMATKSFLEMNPNPDAPIPMPVRIVSWNVRAGKIDAKEIVRKMERLEPDIVLMQEYVWGAECHVKKPLDASTYFIPFHRSGSRQSIVSRWPVKGVPTPELAAWRAHAFRVEMAPGSYVYILNVHLPKPYLKTQIVRGCSPASLSKVLGEMHREIELVRGVIERLAKMGPLVIAGDFNLPPTYPAIRFLNETHKDCFLTNGYGWGKSVPNQMRGRAIKALMRVDMVWVPKDTPVYYTATVPSQASDHHLVLTEVGLPVSFGKAPKRSTEE